MILSAAQSRRFERIRDALIAFALDGNVGVSANGEREWRERADVFDLIVGPAGDLSLIDDFCAKNPARLNRTDLKEVMSWKQGISATFGVMRDGRDIFFILDDAAFCVRGHYHDVDHYDKLPMTCATTLVPFDGLITYVGGYTLLPDIQIHSPVMLERMLTDRRQNRRLARNARDFARLAPPIAERARTQGDEQKKALAALGINVSDLGPNQHVGKLAGLSMKERNAAAAEQLHQMMSTEYDTLAEIFKGPRIKAAPTTSLEEACLLLEDKEIAFLAQNVRLEPYELLKGREATASAIAERCSRLEPYLIDEMVVAGANKVRSVRRLVEEGDLSCDEDDVDARLALPQNLIPAMLNFYHEGRFYTVMPAEIREVLSEVDWEEVVKTAEALDEAVRIMDLACSFRGVIDFDEAIEIGLEGREDLIDWEFLTDAFLRRMDKGMINSRDISCTLPGGIRSTILVNYILEMHFDQFDEEYVDPTPYLQLMEDQSVWEPRPPSMMGAGTDATDWIEKQEFCQRLLHYLDAHIPNQENDYTFADRVFEDLTFCSLYETSPTDLIDVLRDDGFKIGEKQRKAVLDLAAEMADRTPQFLTNGWSKADIREGRAIRAKD